MSKKGTQGRRTSGITPLQVLNALKAEGYAVVSAPDQPPPSTAFRKVVRETQNMLRAFIAPELRQQGHEVVTSRTGDSFYMAHPAGGAQVLLPVKGHLTDTALGAIEQKTRVAVKQLEQKIAQP